MSSLVRIVGQGLAGSLLAWECERQGLAFEVIDAGPATAASRIGAGILNPITGRRFVKSWRVDQLLPAAREVFRAIEGELKVSLVTEYKVRRLFRDDRERRVAAEKVERGELAPYVQSIDPQGLWLAPALRVDLEKLLAAFRARWQQQGRLVSGREDSARPTEADRLTVWCTGAAELSSTRFDFVPWRAAKGEILQLRGRVSDRATIVNAGHWLLPVGDAEAWVGSTYWPNEYDAAPSARGREELIGALAELGAAGLEPGEVVCGVRLGTLDKRPVAGRHPQFPHRGVLNGLGSKGVLYGPLLARDWVRHLRDGRTFDPEVDVARFWRCG